MSILSLVQVPGSPAFWALAILVQIWLAFLAIKDVRRREIPHVLWVAIPCTLAALLCLVRGAWSLSALAAVAVGVSERPRLPHPARRWLFWSGLGLSAGLALISPVEAFPGAVSVIAFWLAYELGWWAGADALAAITLVLLWPDVRLLAALGLVHLALAVWQGRARLLLAGIPRRLAPEELEAAGAPGMPALTISLLMFSLWRAVLS